MAVHAAAAARIKRVFIPDTPALKSGSRNDLCFGLNRENPGKLAEKGRQ
jgi:hypothetical protein